MTSSRWIYLLETLSNLNRFHFGLPAILLIGLLGAAIGFGIATLLTAVKQASIKTMLRERRQAELEALRNHDLREAIFNHSADAIFLVDPETLLTIDCNPRAVELFEADDRQQLLHIEGHTLQAQPSTPEELKAIDQEMSTVGFWSREMQFISLKGRRFWGNLAAISIQVVGTPINVVRVTDVTDRKQSEEQLRISLQEKELLLKEVHHRVKNNLHIISNLLDLQTDQLVDPESLSLFTDSQNRIQAMALIHEQLYQSQDFSQIELGEYVYRLISNLSFSYGNRMRSIVPVIESEPIQINLETAVPCGLLVNELVTNAFKHAFPDGRSGTIQIHLYQDQNQQLNLRVWDDGIGLPIETDWEASSSLGLRLIKILAKQLRASIHFDRNQGTLVHLIFSELQYRSRF